MIACCFKKAWFAGSCGCSPSDVLAHSSAEAHGIRRHHAPVSALVRQHDFSLLTRAGGEVKGTEIGPSAAAHLLVHEEVRSASAMENRVVCIVNALRKRRVGHVNRIFPRLRDVGNPFHAGDVFRVGLRLCHAAGAFGERKHSVRHLRFRCFKTFDILGRFPRCGVAGRGLTVFSVHSRRGIVVNQCHERLDVPFSRTTHHGTGIFQHGEKERIDKRLRQQVFASTVERRALPLPYSFFIIYAVTGPDEEVASVQTAGDFVGSGDILHPGSSRVVCFVPETALVFLSIAQFVGNQVFQAFPFVREQFKFPILHLQGEQVFHRLSDVLQHFRCQFLRGKRLVHHHAPNLSERVGFDGFRFHGIIGSVVFGGVVVKVVFDDADSHLPQRVSLCLQLTKREEQKQREKQVAEKRKRMGHMRVGN